jgi:hypothetical protein
MNFEYLGKVEVTFVNYASVHGADLSGKRVAGEVIEKLDSCMASCHKWRPSRNSSCF